MTGGETIVDPEDYAWLSGFSWHLTRGWVQRTYRRSDGSVRSVKMHRQILGLVPGDGLEGDHVNRNRADNRRSNLRVIPHAKNCHNLSVARNNTSGYRGVSWNGATRKWQASVRAGGKLHYLGRFTDLEEAAQVARDGRRALLTHSHD